MFLLKLFYICYIFNEKFNNNNINSCKSIFFYNINIIVTHKKRRKIRGKFWPEAIKKRYAKSPIHDGPGSSIIIFLSMKWDMLYTRCPHYHLLPKPLTHKPLSPQGLPSSRSSPLKFSNFRFLNMEAKSNTIASTKDESSRALSFDFLTKKPYSPPSWASHLNPLPSHVFSLGHVSKLILCNHPVFEFTLSLCLAAWVSRELKWWFWFFFSSNEVVLRAISLLVISFPLQFTNGTFPICQATPRCGWRYCPYLCS